MKSKISSKISDKHFENSQRMATTAIKPDISKQHKISTNYSIYIYIIYVIYVYYYVTLLLYIFIYLYVLCIYITILH